MNSYAKLSRIQRPLLGAQLFLLLTVAVTSAIALSSLLRAGPGEASPRAPQARAFGRLGTAGGPVDVAPAAASMDKDKSKPPKETPSPADFVWPVDGYIVQGMWAGHPLGIDIGASTGDPVRATRAGKVIFVGGDSCCSYGNFIIILHDDQWSSLYGHLSAFNVKVGDEVKQGQRIGSVGMTGHADGPHLHFELRSYGGVVDPLAYLWPHRSAPPPPPYVVADAPAQSASEPSSPAATPAPARSLVSISPGAAIYAALPYLSSTADASYELDSDSCSAIAAGPNWIVNCRAILQGCADPTACVSIVTACVLSQPVLVTSVCQ